MKSVRIRSLSGRFFPHSDFFPNSIRGVTEYLFAFRPVVGKYVLIISVRLFSILFPDVTMGAYDGAEVCEFVGIFIHY